MFKGVKSERVSRVGANSPTASTDSTGEPMTEKMLRATTAIDLKIGAIFDKSVAKKKS